LRSKAGGKGMERRRGCTLRVGGGAGGLGMKLLAGGLSLRREADGTDGSMVLL
jgi:hypothetical protein